METEAYEIELSLCQQIITSTAASTASTNAIGKRKVVLYSTTDCFVNYAAAPTAGSTGAANIFVPANTFVTIKLAASTNKIAARADSANGVLYINPLVR